MDKGVSFRHHVLAFRLFLEDGGPNWRKEGGTRRGALCAKMVFFFDFVVKFGQFGDVLLDSEGVLADLMLNFEKLVAFRHIQ